LNGKLDYGVTVLEVVALVNELVMSFVGILKRKKKPMKIIVIRGKN
jgi:hypothetical protein